MVKPIAQLYKWSIVGVADVECPAPEQFTARLQGFCVDRCRFDYELVITTRLIAFDSIKKIAETKNTFYILEDIDPEFLAYLALRDNKLEDYNFDKRITNEQKE